ncbi:adrenocorticotropic hormone receptor-like [Lytechinus variegatus]|uniref:adrenocorticotropic hormone receptor-like n=1 Tax=Lytechinus variegatus TaxID=7654 RepID=UPI001BB1FE98|nr:adrenocorticotropic hormone receptor-like [Lytechinus variegatus]
MAIVDTVAWVIPLLMGVLGVILNLLSMGAILSFRALRKIKNMFIFHLSFCDFVSSISIMITYVIYLTPLELSTMYLQLTFAVSLSMSLVTTLAIAVERFILFYLDPFGNRKIITPFRAILALLVAWACVGGVFYLLGTTFRKSVYAYLVGKVIFSFSIFIIITVTISLYMIIYKKVTSASKGLGSSDTFLQRRFKMHQKIIVTFSLVVGTTGLCWSPLTVTEIFKGLPAVNDKAWYFALDRVFFSILCINQVLNPIIVWSRLTEFRNRLKLCRRDGTGTTNMTHLASVSANVPVNSRSSDNPNFI